MSIGGGIALIVIGAILAFAINVEEQVVDLDMIGYILMGAGVVVLLIGIILMVRKHQTVSTTRTIDSRGEEQITERRTSSDEV